MNRNKRIYLDHAATTPIDSEVLAAMNQVYKENYFNPGGLYREGVLVDQKINEARKSVASLLGTTTDRIIFTRGGTESNNMAILGVLTNLTPRLTSSPSPERRGELPHVIVSEIEHSAVLETVKYLEKNKKIELSIIPVDKQGIVIVDEIKKALKPETVLVSVMYVNNEIGTIQPIKEIAKLIRWYKKQNDQKMYPLFHTDAIQATNYLDINVERLGIDFMSLSGSKIYGPKSSGILYARDRKLLGSVFHGGDQEFGLRAGTEDGAQIIGFAKALEKTRTMAESESVRLQELQNYFFVELEKNLTGFQINGSRENRICNNINISIEGVPSERLVIELDAKEVCASSKSACREENEESYVIAALRKGNKSGQEGSLRFTLGRTTTQENIKKTVIILKNIVEAIRKFEQSMV